MFASWFDAMAAGGPDPWFDPDVDDESLQSLPPEAWDPPDPDDDLLDPPIELGTAAATDEALIRLRKTTRWSHVSEARRFEALLLSMDAIHAEHDAVGDRVLTASVLTRGFTVEAGACLLVDPRTVETLLDRARQARGTLPRTWAAFRAGDCGWRSVETVFRESVGLDPTHLAEFDQHAGGLVGSSTTGRLARDLTRLRERLQADTAVERAWCSARARHVSVTPLRDGQAMLSIVGPSPAIASIYDGLTTAAVAAHGDPDEDRHLGALRHDVAVDLLLGGLRNDPQADARSGEDLRVPQRKAVTATCLIVLPALSVLGKSAEPAEVAGYGPIDVETAMRHAGDAGYWTRVFTDPTTGALMGLDAHAERIPTAWRRWLTLRDGTCRAPGCNRSAATCDVDHTIRREHGGPTALENLSCLCRTHHQVKDDGCWNLTLHPDGTQEWRSIWGTTRHTRPDVLVGMQPKAPPPTTPPPPPSEPPDHDCPF